MSLLDKRLASRSEKSTVAFLRVCSCFVWSLPVSLSRVERVERVEEEVTRD